MTDLYKIVNFTDTLLRLDCKDGCPNGLQVQGKDEVRVLVSAVTASMALLEQALAVNADCILVHHGYFWRHDASVITGMHYNKIKLLIENGISLMAYHLPLDYHASLGNNAQLAKAMHWHIDGRLASTAGLDLGMYGRLAQPMTVAELGVMFTKQLSHKPLILAYDQQKVIKTVAWCTGAAGDDIHYAIAQGVDAFITGEVPERIVHIAREAGIVVFAAGHHATERYGVQAVGGAIAKEFAVDHQYIEIPSPI